MFVNISNHPSIGWGEKQWEAAREYGKVVDLAFPNVNPEASETEVCQMAEELLGGVYELQWHYDEPCGMIHLVGEPTLTFAAVSLLQSRGFKVCTSTTKRISTENPDGTITKKFAFERFREYMPYKGDAICPGTPEP